VQSFAQVDVELKGGRQIGLELAANRNVEEMVTEVIEVVAVRQASGPRREPRPHAASAEELERHRKFVAGLENPLWG